jgi:hypothetical protein
MRLEGCDSSASSVYLRAKNRSALMECVHQISIDNQSAFRMVSDLEVSGRTSKRPTSFENISRC